MMKRYLLPCLASVGAMVLSFLYPISSFQRPAKPPATRRAATPPPADPIALRRARLERDLQNLRDLSGSYQRSSDAARERHQQTLAAGAGLTRAGEIAAQQIDLDDAQRDLDEALARQQEAATRESVLAAEIQHLASPATPSDLSNNSANIPSTALEIHNAILAECEDVKRLVAQIDALGSGALQSAIAETGHQYNAALDRLREQDAPDEIATQQTAVATARQQYDAAVTRKKDAQSRTQELLAEIESRQQRLDLLQTAAPRS